MTDRDGRAALPGIVLITGVAGVGMLAVLATSLGLVPLYGDAELSLDGWRKAAPDLAAGAVETLRIAVPASLLAAVVGLLLATLVLAGGRGSTLVRTGCVAVLAVPHLVGATSVGLLLGDGGVAARVLSPVVGDGAWPALVGGTWPVATVLELAWKESAFVALVVGAGRWHRFARVLVPTAAPALAVSSMVTLVYAIGSYEVAWLLGRASPEPLPVLAYRLFGSIELTDRPAAAAAAATAAALAMLLAVPALAALPRLRTGLSPDRSPS